MKLDIEELAREAGFHVYNGCIDGITADAKALARLIVKQCALTVKKRDTGDCTREDKEVKRCEAAILQLLEGK